MLHDLLLALSGCPGDVFVQDKDTYRVLKGLPLLHPCEAELLNRLAHLGWLYHGLHAFCSSTLSPRLPTPSSSSHQGMSLGNGGQQHKTSKEKAHFSFT
eukprot:m.404408 g.404408  ORF g.404408 m.404408 type:complete len:99 (-) comp20126_c0_seq5:122-418(-)